MRAETSYSNITGCCAHQASEMPCALADTEHPYYCLSTKTFVHSVQYFSSGICIFILIGNTIPCISAYFFAC